MSLEPSQDGNLFIVDRLKEILKVRGFQVAPAELEGSLLAHEAVADVGVVGVPDPYSQEVPAAFVVLSAKFAEAAKRDAEEGKRIKESIAQVRALAPGWLTEAHRSWFDSTCLQGRRGTNGSTAGSISSTLYPEIRVGKFS